MKLKAVLELRFRKIQILSKDTFSVYTYEFFVLMIYLMLPSISQILIRVPNGRLVNNNS
jgi:ABC-type arginine transport system permease subunit